MKNKIDYGSLNVHPGVFSLEKFIESDAPGALSWLNMDADELNSDVPALKEVERRSLALPCAGTTLNKQWLRLSASLRSVQASRLKLLAR